MRPKVSATCQRHQIQRKSFSVSAWKVIRHVGNFQVYAKCSRQSLMKLSRPSVVPEVATRRIRTEPEKLRRQQYPDSPSVGARTATVTQHGRAPGYVCSVHQSHEPLQCPRSPHSSRQRMNDENDLKPCQVRQNVQPKSWCASRARDWCLLLQARVTRHAEFN